MLVLRRQTGDRVSIQPPQYGGKEIQVIVLSVERGRVQLGFEADRDTKIIRTEIKE